MADRFYIETFGCQMNEYDSAKMADVLVEHFGARVEQRSLLEEKARFALPTELTQLATSFASKKSPQTVEASR